MWLFRYLCSRLLINWTIVIHGTIRSCMHTCRYSRSDLRHSYWLSAGTVRHRTREKDRNRQRKASPRSPCTRYETLFSWRCSISSTSSCFVAEGIVTVRADVFANNRLSLTLIHSPGADLLLLMTGMIYNGAGALPDALIDTHFGPSYEPTKSPLMYHLKSTGFDGDFFQYLKVNVSLTAWTMSSNNWHVAIARYSYS